MIDNCLTIFFIVWSKHINIIKLQCNTEIQLCFQLGYFSTVIFVWLIKLQNNINVFDIVMNLLWRKKSNHYISGLHSTIKMMKYQKIRFGRSYCSVVEISRHFHSFNKTSQFVVALSQERSDLVTTVSVCSYLWLAGYLVMGSYNFFPVFKISLDFKHPKIKMCFRTFWAT